VRLSFYMDDELLRKKVQVLVLRILEFFEDNCDAEKDEQNKLFDTWKDQAKVIRRATLNKDYICASNLVILMEWRIEADEHWMIINRNSVRDKQHEDVVSYYVDLRESMDHLISSVELVVLLRKL